MHKAFANCASQYSWNTVIEIIQMQRRYGADMEFKHERLYLVLIFMYQTTRQFGFPLDPLEDLNLCTSHF